MNESSIIDRNNRTANNIRHNKNYSPKKMNIRLLNDIEKTQKVRREIKNRKTSEVTPRYTFNIRDDKQIKFGRNSYKLSSLLEAQMN